MGLPPRRDDDRTEGQRAPGNNAYRGDRRPAHPENVLPGLRKCHTSNRNNGARLIPPDQQLARRPRLPPHCAAPGSSDYFEADSIVWRTSKAVSSKVRLASAISVSLSSNIGRADNDAGTPNSWVVSSRLPRRQFTWIFLKPSFISNFWSQRNKTTAA
jgi:hypothetical protein